MVLAGLLGGLVVLAVLQYQWLDRLSAAERSRLQVSVNHAAGRFCDDIDREVLRATITFLSVGRGGGGDLDDRLVQQARRWRSEAPFPDLIRRVALVRPGDGATDSVACLERGSEALQPCAWPAEFAALRGTLAAHQQSPSPFVADVPGLVLPAHRFPGWRERGGEPGGLDGDALTPGGGTGRRGEVGQREPAPPALLLISFDEAYITGQMLPRIAALYFGEGAGMAYTVTVVDRMASNRVLFSSSATAVAPTAAGSDASRTFFALRPFRGLAAAGLDRSIWGRDPAPPGWSGPRGVGEGGVPSGGQPGIRRQEHDDDPGTGLRGSGRWLLVVHHTAGSLDAAVAQARRRNLAIGAVVLLLLAASAILLVVSSQRAERLARQQLDFVAGVSHELRTPLTAIRSAGQNLADGVVADPEQVRRYGSLIASEGRRLSDLASRVLTFAGIRSGGPLLELHPLAIAAVIEEVRHEAHFVLDEKGFEVEVEIPADLPAVAGDAAALKQVLHNLIDNAVKFGAAAHWLAIRASVCEVARGREVSIAISDRGPGIRKADLGRIFEPFARGTNPATARMPGSGLGLAVVRHLVAAHSGRVEVHSTPGEGATFDVRLPALPADAVEGA